MASQKSETKEAHNKVQNIDAIVRLDGIFQFNGNGDAVEIYLPNTFPKFLNGERTISAWFKTSTHDRIVVSIGSAEKCPPNEQFAIAVREKDVMLYGHVKGNDFAFSGSTGYLDNKWRHLVVTKKGNNAQLYINSKYIGKTNDHKYETGKSNRQKITVGGWIDKNRPFNGYIGDVRVYDQALSAADIVQLYEQGLKKNVYK